jgi:dTMP kinase
LAYLAFEGGEGSGKSTQARLLAARLDAVLTREPGGTPLGAKLRTLLLDPGQEPVGPRAETLLMAADRAQHIRDVVAPALAQGRHVVSDRSVYSSLAYQGGGRQLGVDNIRRLNDWALDGCWPDLVVLLDLDPETADQRLDRVAGLDRSLDRLEQEDRSFHQRVRGVFLELANGDRNWIMIPAHDTIEAVEAKIWAAVEPRLAVS